MKAKRSCTLAIVLVLLAAPSLALVQPYAVGTAFTYQGQLKQGGLPVNGTADFEFSLWDEAGSGQPPSGGNQIGSMVPASNVNVINGLFTVQLDFGASAFNGEDARWLGIAVRSPAGSGPFTPLTPRQRLTPAPFALQTRGITVDSGGKVGIGKTNPSYKLDVFGIIRTTFGGILFPDGSFQTTAIRSLSPRGVAEFTNGGPNTWVAPDGVYTVLAELWGGSGGGGGGGAGGQTLGGSGGGGGGGSGYLRLVVNVTPGGTYTVRIGSAGTSGAGGVAGDGGDGTDGSPTQFEAPDGSVLALAGGGEGGGGGAAAGGGGGASGAGGVVNPTEGIARPGGDGGDGWDEMPSYPEWGAGYGGGGETAIGTMKPVDLPYYEEAYDDDYPGRGGWGGNSEQAGGGDSDSGLDGINGYAVLHW